MRIASAGSPGGERVLVAPDGELLRPVTYDAAARSWRFDSRPPLRLAEADLRRPFEPLSLVAPGPRITAPAEWAERHREFHVKPASVLAPSTGAPLGASGPMVYRVQAGMVFAPTPRAAGAGALRDGLLGIHLVVELVSCGGFTLGWEGPRWHLRYAEGLSFDAACPTGEWLVTPDELDPDGIVVEHGAGSTQLAWAQLLEFAAFVNRYVDLGPHTMLLAGWADGPSLGLTAGAPTLAFDAPAAAAGALVWAEHPALGRVECRVDGARR